MFVDVHGTKLRVREAGAAAAGKPPLLMIHGAGASSAIWLELMHRLSRHRRCVALDLPGHGRSGGAVSSVAEMRDAVGGVAAALCLGPSVLVGHSLGGLVAQAAALAWPDKVAGLILITTGARLGVSTVVFQNLETRWPRWPEILAETAFSAETPADVRRAAAGLACAASQAQTIADFRACTTTDFREQVSAIRAPTLVVTAEHDLMTPPKWGQALAAAIPGAKLYHLPRCGHMPLAEQPDRLAEGIVDSLG